MNTYGLIGIVVIAGLTLPGGLAGPPQKPSAADPCANATTQRELNDCAGQKYKQADAEMNHVYRALWAKLDGRAREALEKAQRLWLQFRDAHLVSIYPSPDPRGYGSVHAMCVAEILAELTSERTNQLRRMLEPIEGNVCRY